MTSSLAISVQGMLMLAKWETIIEHCYFNNLPEVLYFINALQMEMLKVYISIYIKI